MFTDATYGIPEVDVEYCVRAGRQTARLTVFETIDIRAGGAQIRRRAPLLPANLKGGKIVYSQEDEAGLLLDIELEEPWDGPSPVPDRYWLTWVFDSQQGYPVEETNGRRFFQWATDRQHQQVFFRVCFPADDVPNKVSYATWERTAGGCTVMSLDSDRPTRRVGVCEDAPLQDVVKFNVPQARISAGSYGFVWDYS